MVMVLVLAIGVLSTACAKTVTEKVIESQTGGKVKLNSKKGSVEIEGKDGNKVKIGENKLPSDFPKDAPVYKPSTIKGSISSTSQGKKASVVTVSTDDDLDTVVAFYKKELTGNGWTEMSALTGGEGGSQFAALGYEKGDTVVGITVSLAGNGKETEILLSVSAK